MQKLFIFLYRKDVIFLPILLGILFTAMSVKIFQQPERFGLLDKIINPTLALICLTTVVYVLLDKRI